MKDFVQRLPPDLQRAWRETVSASFRTRAAQRKPVEGTCAVCGGAFVGIKLRRYCSRHCQQRAYNLRRAARPAPTAPEGDSDA